MSLIGLEGSCECGAVKLRTSSKLEAWGLFVCHCSMCPDHSYTDSRVGSGVGWLAVPRDEDLYYDSSRHDVDTRRTSEFARRAYCKQCGSKLTMQYDCEPYTTWICIDRFRIGRDQVIALAKNKAHIHCADTIDEGAKGQKGDDVYDAHSPKEHGADGDVAIRGAVSHRALSAAACRTWAAGRILPGQSVSTPIASSPPATSP